MKTSPTKRDEVRQFLENFKRAAEKNGIRYADREKNWEYLVELGIIFNHRDDILFGLAVENYVKGPHPDKGGSGKVWVFGVEINETEVYIKIKLIYINDQYWAKCISLHPAENNLNYPLKERRQL